MTITHPLPISWRLLARPLCVLVLLAGCQSNMPWETNATPLTPQQQELRNQSIRWYQRVATGALIGAAAGAALGATSTSEHRGMAALLGAGIGLVVGSVAGVISADNTLIFEQRELNAARRIESAQQTAARFQQTAAISERVAIENRQRLAQLDQQYRSNQITAEQYRSATANMRDDLEMMRKTAAEAQETRQRLVASAQQEPALMAEEPAIDAAQRRLETSAGELDDVLRKVPLG